MADNRHPPGWLVRCHLASSATTHHHHWRCLCHPHAAETGRVLLLTTPTDRAPVPLPSMLCQGQPPSPPTSRQLCSAKHAGSQHLTALSAAPQLTDWSHTRTVVHRASAYSDTALPQQGPCRLQNTHMPASNKPPRGRSATKASSPQRSGLVVGASAAAARRAADKVAPPPLMASALNWASALHCA
jgi:hypothetical protein